MGITKFQDRCLKPLGHPSCFWNQSLTKIQKEQVAKLPPDCHRIGAKNDTPRKCRGPGLKNTAPAIQLKPAGKNEEAYAASTLNRVASELAATSEGHRDSTLMSVTAPL